MSKLYRRNMSRIFCCGWLLTLVLSGLIGCAKLDKPEQPIASTDKVESLSLMSGDELFVEALRYENDLNGRKTDYKKMVTLLRMAANKGSAAAADMLASIYYEGSYSQSKDYKEAFIYARDAVNGGSILSMNTLGVFYLNGVGTDVNTGEAFSWYQKAARLGQDDAQANLGGLYLEGIGVKRNLKKAEYWLKKASLQNNAGGKRNYARLLCYKERTPVRDCDLNRDLHLDTPMSDVEP